LLPWDGGPTAETQSGVTPEVVEFLGEFFKRRPDGRKRARSIFANADGLAADVDLEQIAPFAVAFRYAEPTRKEATRSASTFWVDWVSRFGPPSRSTKINLGELLEVIKGARDIEIVLAATLLLCHELAGNQIDPAAVVAALVEPDYLAERVDDARRTRSQVYVESVRRHLLAAATDRRTRCIAAPP
jgi:hypothetical protein